jgi:hypothetical protein
LDPSAEVAVMDILSLRLSEIIRAENDKNAYNAKNFAILDISGMGFPRSNNTDEYAVAMNNVSIPTCAMHDTGSYLHHAFVFTNLLLASDPGGAL